MDIKEKSRRNVIMEMILQTKNLTKKYGTQFAAQNLNLNVERGKIYGLLGRNGAGKTTTLRMITGLLEPTNGEVILFGEKMKTPTKQIFRRIGALIEAPAFYEEHSLKLLLRML